MLGGKGKGGRVGQRESPSGTEVSPCLRVANLQKIFFLSVTISYRDRDSQDPKRRSCWFSLVARRRQLTTCQ
jgi:hypothetical protein